VNTSAISVVIADDQDLVRAGLRMIVEATEDIVVVAEAAHGQAAIDLAARYRPDVVLMDVRMPQMDGIHATQWLHEHMPEPPRVLMLTTFDSDDAVYAALRAGASGFLLKSAPPARLVDAIRCVYAGEALLAPAITRRLIEAQLSRVQPDGDLLRRLDALTARELEVLTLVGRGLSNSEIAEKLTISEATVKTHINRMFAKLAITERVKAVVLAYETGLVQPGSSNAS
jgi:DNA-binding NarL/FixJ family response regulator